MPTFDATHFATRPVVLTHRALVRAKRRPCRTTPKGGTFAQLIGDTRRGVKYGVTPGGPTASWRYDHGTNRHHIKLGDAFALSMNVAPPRSTAPANMDRHAADFADALLLHEAAHGRFTDRDLGAMADKCRRLGVPFLLFNLFEDARIEACERGRTSEPFGWTRWLHVDRATGNHPLAAFSALVNQETKDWKVAQGFGFGTIHARAIADFYSTACASPSSGDVIDVCRAWLDYWKGGSKETEAGSAPGTPAGRLSGVVGDVADGSLPGEGGAPAPTAPKPATPAAQPNTKPETVREDGTLGAGRKGADSPMSELADWTFFASANAIQQLDAQAIERTAGRLARIVAASASPTSARVSASGSRLHMSGVASGAAESFRTHGKVGGKPRLVVVMDFSSSMSGHFRAHGFPFLVALARLARRGVLDVKLYATGNGHCARIPDTLTDAQFRRLHSSCGCESVALTLERIRSDVEQAHATVVYTDAALTDGRVDSAKWRARGADVMGACVVPDSVDPSHRERMRGAMRHHFGFHVIAPTGEQLATKLAGLLGERAARAR